ncbi:hypothetical protein Pmani_019071, partial [Petrolisthes manimaculis]
MKDGEFDWNEGSYRVRSWGSFYIGYLFTNLLGGRAARVPGGVTFPAMNAMLSSWVPPPGTCQILQHRVFRY